MSKEKNKNTFRVAALLLVACLISSVMLSGTFAKYTSEYAGEDTALVARWSFTSDLLAEGTATVPAELDLFGHLYDTHINPTGIDGEDEERYIIAPGIQGEFTVDFTYDADVDADLTFDFTKSGNYSAVPAENGISGTAAAPVPIQYSLDPNFNTIYYDLEDLEDNIIDVATNTTISKVSPGHYTIKDTVAGGAVTINKTVYWRWPYETTSHNTVDNATKRALAGFPGTGAAIGETGYKVSTDADDTAIGNISKTLDRGSYILNLVISATQIEPEQTNN
jgi:hypothetical protein